VKEMQDHLAHIHNGSFQTKASFALMVIVKHKFATSSSAPRALREASMDADGGWLDWRGVLVDNLFVDDDNHDPPASPSKLSQTHTWKKKKKKKQTHNKKEEAKQESGALRLWKLLLRRAEWWLHVADYPFLSVSDIHVLDEYELLPPTYHQRSASLSLVRTQTHNHSEPIRRAVESLRMRANVIGAIANVRMSHYTRALEVTNPGAYGMCACVYVCVQLFTSPPCYWLCRPYIRTASKWGRDLCARQCVHCYVSLFYFNVVVGAAQALQANDLATELMCTQLLDVHLYSLTNHSMASRSATSCSLCATLLCTTAHTCRRFCGTDMSCTSRRAM
jgi:hypothetical protein